MHAILSHPAGACVHCVPAGWTVGWCCALFARPLIVTKQSVDEDDSFLIEYQSDGEKQSMVVWGPQVGALALSFGATPIRGQH